MSAEIRILAVLLTVAEAAARLRVKPSWIYGHIHAGTLPFRYVKVGHYVRISEQELDDYIERSTQPTRQLREVRG